MYIYIYDCIYREREIDGERETKNQSSTCERATQSERVIVKESE